MEPSDDIREQELHELRRALEASRQRLLASEHRLAQSEAGHRAFVDDVHGLLLRMRELARFATENTLYRHLLILSPEARATHTEAHLRNEAAAVNARSIEMLSDAYTRSPRRAPVDLGHVIDTARYDLENHWHILSRWDAWLSEFPRNEALHGCFPGGSPCLAPFELTVRRMPSVNVDARWMLCAIRYLLVYALCRTQRSPRVLRMGSARLADESVFYITDSDDDVIPVAPQRVARWRRTLSPEFAMFCCAVRAHGGIVWKQRMGAEQGAILFSLPDEAPAA